MKCEYCGSYLPVFPEGGTCPNCGATLPACDLEKKSKGSAKDSELEKYYRMYRPDRIRAIMALRIDTGMDPVSAKTMIDYIFNYYDGPETE